MQNVDDIIVEQDDGSANRALNTGRIYDCGRVPPLPKQKGKQNQANSNIDSLYCFTLLSFLKSSHTNRRKNAYSESGWRRRIERGQISVDGVVIRDPDYILSKAKQHVEYHRFPWREPILQVVSTSEEAAKGEEEYRGDEACLKILYVDDHLLVIHKPSGLPTMPSQTYFEYSVLNAFRRLYEDRTSVSNGSENSPQRPTNVFATARARQLIQSHCSAEPQPVHRLGVGTSGVLVVATSLLGRQRLTDAIRLKSNNIDRSGRSTVIRKVYRALVHARRCDDRPGKGSTNINENGFPVKRNGPLIPDFFTIDCPIGLVPFPIGGDSIHAARPLESDSLYGHVHEKKLSVDNENTTTSEGNSPTAIKQTRSSSPPDNDASKSSSNKEQRSTTKPALSYVRLLCLKNSKNANGSSSTMEDTALVEVEIPTGRPHQIRIHMAYAGYPLVGDPLYLPGGIPNTVARNFESLEKEEEDMETDDENDSVEENANETTAKTTFSKKKYIQRVALPRDCGYYLHAHTITLEHPSSDQRASGSSIDASAAMDSYVSDESTVVTFTAPPPSILRE